MSRISALILVLVLVFAAVALADSSGRIYGRILTVEGDEFEGLIRWDKNEGSWVDILNGTKELPERSDSRSGRSRRKKYGERKSSIEIFGIKLGYSSTSFSWSSSASSGIRFGHIKMMEVIGDDEVRLTLKSGKEVELSGGSTDIGDNVREIIIEDRDEGEIELVWDDIESIEFEQADKNLESNYGERLYGTLTTRRGDEFTGFVCWDMDELFVTDILDGKHKGRRRKIKFGKIASIERYSSSGANVILRNGDELLLRGTNDVNDRNSGIVISDPGFGQVIVEWDEFASLEFGEAPSPVAYDAFDGGKALRGTVFTEDGESYSGRIIWDRDEEYSWEILDGEFRKVQFDIEFGLIKELKKKGYRATEVTVLDGRTFRLRGSNDVDESNKGIIIILADGEEVEVEWDDFDRLEFAWN